MAFLAALPAVIGIVEGVFDMIEVTSVIVEIGSAAEGAITGMVASGVESAAVAGGSGTLTDE